MLSRGFDEISDVVVVVVVDNTSDVVVDDGDDGGGDDDALDCDDYSSTDVDGL